MNYSTTNTTSLTTETHLPGSSLPSISNDPLPSWLSAAAAVGGFCVTLLIIWVTIKVIECRRYGFKLDYFHEDVEPLMSIEEAKKVNFLYNKAVQGKQYQGRRGGQGDGMFAVQKLKTRSSKSANGASVKSESKKLKSSLDKAVDSIANKFNINVKQKVKKKKLEEDEEELHPTELKKLPKKKKRIGNARSYRQTNVIHNGKTVPVPVTKHLASARPLPQPPPTALSTSISDQ